MVGHEVVENGAHVVHDEAAAAEHAAPPGRAQLDEEAEHHRHHGRREEGAPDERAAPPRREGLESEQHAADGRAERRRHPGAGADGHQVAPVPVVLEVAQPAAGEAVLAGASLPEDGGDARAGVDHRPRLADVQRR